MLSDVALCSFWLRLFICSGEIFNSGPETSDIPLVGVRALLLIGLSAVTDFNDY